MIIILVIIVLIFGASRIKGLARALGEGIKEFRRAKNGEEITEEEEVASSAK